MKKIFLLVLFINGGLVIKGVTQSKPELLVDDLNPQSFNQNFSEYDQKTALFCAQLSELAYWDAARLEMIYQVIKYKYPAYGIQYKMIDFKNSGNHTQALLWATKDFLVVSFRGTEPTKLRDWFTDTKFWNYTNTESSNHELNNMPAGHGGFRRSLMNLMLKKDLFGEIFQLMKIANPATDSTKFPVFLTGHSLGAAISQMFIEPLSYRKLAFSGAYHFAPPLAVSCEVNEYMKAKYGSLVYDIVNYKDFVPRAGRNHVAHFGKYYRICNDGLMYKETEAYVRFKLREFRIRHEIKLHSLATHIDLIRKTENVFQQINERSIGHTPCMELASEPRKLCGK